MLPERDGIDTVREIPAIDPSAIILTMSGRDEDYQEVARMLGARREFRKLVEIAEVLRALRQAEVS